jgi:hypothetical protein
MNTNGAGTGVDCRLTINGVTIDFRLAGPLVAMAPAVEKTAKRPSRKGAK